MKRTIAFGIFVFLWIVGQYFLRKSELATDDILIFYGLSYGSVLWLYNMSFANQNFKKLYGLSKLILKHNDDLIKQSEVTQRLNDEVMKQNISLLDEIILLKTKEFN